LIGQGARSSKLNVNDKQKLEKDILPSFSGMNVKDVTYKHLNAYIAKLSARQLKASTIKNYLNVIHKILFLAQRGNLVGQIPAFPKVKRLDSSRGWFNQKEYQLLRSTTKKLLSEKTSVRSHQKT
jgi:hypothetical protein